MNNIVGNRFHRLIITKDLGIFRKNNNKNKQHYYLAKCDCGNEVEIAKINLKRVQSCGCAKRTSLNKVSSEIGKKYNRLTIVSMNKKRTDAEYKRGYSGVFYNCTCDCGNETVVKISALKTGHIKSCGCSKFNNPLVIDDLTGKTFGRLTVIKRDLKKDLMEKSKSKRRSVFWVCRCTCGNITTARSYSLKKGITKSCGCLASEILIKRNKECSKKYNRPIKLKSNTFMKGEDIVTIYDQEMTNCFVIDQLDLEYITKWYWRKICKNDGYNRRKMYWVTNAHKEDVENGLPSSIKLHQIIAFRKYGNYDKKIHVPDHLNRNPDDNTRKNIVLKTIIENSHNRGLSVCNKSGKTGVFYSKDKNKWVVSITVNYKRIHLGLFFNFEEAVSARKKAEKKYKFKCDDEYPDYDIEHSTPESKDNG